MRCSIVKQLIAVCIIMGSFVSCSDDSNQRVASNVTFGVEAVQSECLQNGFILFAVVDENDKYEWSADIDCKALSHSAHLDDGDLLELKVFNYEVFDKSTLFNYHIEYKGVLHEFNNVPYTGVQLLLQ